MGDFYIKGKQVCGTTTNNASIITYLDKDSNKSTIQKEIENVQTKINKLNSDINHKIQKFIGTELLSEDISTTSSMTIPQSIDDFNMLVAVVSYEFVSQGREKTLVFNRPGGTSRISRDVYNVYSTNDVKIGITCELNWNTGVITLDYSITSTQWTNSLPLVFKSIVGY